MQDKISTQTIIGYGTSPINVECLFNTIVDKDRVSKALDADLVQGDIVTVEFMQSIFSNRKKKSKSNGSSAKFFRNALTITMFVGKFINFKMSKNGKVQFTGCRTVKNAEDCIRCVFELCQENNVLSTVFPGHETFEMYFITVMTNIGFKMGFNIDREHLTQFVKDSEHANRIKTSFGYTAGVKAVIVSDEFIDYDVPVFSTLTSDLENSDLENSDLENSDLENSDLENLKNISAKSTTVKYSFFLEKWKNELSAKIMNPVKRNTFIVFHSGNIIMSGCNERHMEKDYAFFKNLLLTNRDRVEEHLS